MSQPLFMGIDGGGSKLRIAVFDANLNELSIADRGLRQP